MRKTGDDRPASYKQFAPQQQQEAPCDDSKFSNKFSQLAVEGADDE